MRLIVSRLFLLVVLGGSLPISARAQSDADQQGPPPVATVPSLTAVARSVVLDVVVEDAKGHSVRGLKQGNFTLVEDGVPQRLTSFEEHRTDLPGAAPIALPKLPANTFTNQTIAPNSSTSTIILVDALDTSIDAQMYLHEQVIEYMKRVPPGTSMAVFLLDERMHLVQGFTTDPQALLAAVESKRDTPHFGIYGGGNVIYQRLRHDILTEGMQELGRYLSGFPGRKNLIWFTGYVPRELYGSGIGNPFHDEREFVDDLQQTTDVLALSKVAVYPVDARGLIAPQGGRQPHLGQALAYNQDTLEQVARATGGKAFYNNNGLKDAIAEVVDTGSNYYTVSYTPSNKEWNGATRHIQVEVAGTYSDEQYTLQYRRGYRAFSHALQEEHHLAAVQRRKSSGNFTPSAEMKNSDPASVLLHRGADESLQSSLTLGAIPPTELLFAASVTASPEVQKLDKKAQLPQDNYLRPSFQGKPFRDYEILYATDVRKLDLSQTPDGIRHDQVDFVVVVYNDQGDVVNSLITTVGLDLSDATYRRLAQTGFSMTQKIAVPVKGNYFFRMGIRDGGGDHVGAMEVPVEAVKLGVAGAGQSVAP